MCDLVQVLLQSGAKIPLIHQTFSTISSSDNDTMFSVTLPIVLAIMIFLAQRRKNQGRLRRKPGSSQRQMMILTTLPASLKRSKKRPLRSESKMYKIVPHHMRQFKT